MSENFDKLVSVMARLRSADGCPWDREQTLQTLRTYLLEETYETLDAIDRDDAEGMKEELGDLLLEVVFLCQVCSERDLFTIDQVAGSIHEKLIRRHPHVFGGEKAAGAREALGRWEEMKNKEREASEETSVLAGVPEILPALLRAFRISNKAAMVGFDWDNVAQILAKVDEELAELRQAIASNDAGATAEELGDLLFAAANVGRLAGVDPETALQAANRKFTRRFKSVEEGLRRSGLKPSAENRDLMEDLWDEAKAQSRGAR